MRTMLANSLRGVVAQLLLKKTPEAGSVDELRSMKS